MIISASRRTDIPALYADWFVERIRAGYCAVPNPFNPRQVSQVSLQPADVDVIVFWTRHALPLMRHLGELDDLGYRYYFHYTILGYPRLLEPKRPALERSIDVFRKLADRVGPDRVIWRYDPILLSSVTDADYHVRTFAEIAQALHGYTRRCVVSFVDKYAKTRRRLGLLESEGRFVVHRGEEAQRDMARLAGALAGTCSACGMALTSCAEPEGLGRYGILPGKCIDDELIRRVFGIQVSARKDPAQRVACGCVVSRDIGVYETCSFGCEYCYATSDPVRARENYKRHDPMGVSLTG